MNAVFRALHRSLAVDPLWVLCVLGHPLNHQEFGNCQKRTLGDSGGFSVVRAWSSLSWSCHPLPKGGVPSVSG